MMRSITIFTKAVIISAVLLAGCKKDDKKETAPQTPPYSCSKCSSTPEGIAANDASSAGVYKGILVGSTGTFKVVLKNGNEDIKIIASFDNITDTLTSADLSSWNNGDAINNAVFTGSKGITMSFSVNADGSNPSVNVTIAGHSDVSATVAKESSTELIKCYEGTFSGGASGVLNYWVSDSDFAGVAKSTSGKPDVFNGTIVEKMITGVTTNGAAISGTTNGDNASGTWQYSSSDRGNWTAKRTL